MSDTLEFALVAAAHGITRAQEKALRAFLAGLLASLPDDADVVARLPLHPQGPDGDREAAEILAQCGVQAKRIRAVGSTVPYDKIPLYMARWTLLACLPSGGPPSVGGDITATPNAFWKITNPFPCIAWRSLWMARYVMGKANKGENWHPGGNEYRVACATRSVVLLDDGNVHEERRALRWRSPWRWGVHTKVEDRPDGPRTG